MDRSLVNEWMSAVVNPAVRVTHREEPVGVRHAQQPAQLVDVERAVERQPPPVLLERADDFWSASLKVRPIAMTSPRISSGCRACGRLGNFSNAQRGT